MATSATDQVQPFGYKGAWLAVRGKTAKEVAAALRLTGTRESTWAEGIAAAYESAKGSYYSRSVFITPPIDGWTLALSTAFFAHLGDGEDPDLSAWVRRLSAELHTEVQFFATYRVSDGHAWALARDGKLVRAYCVFDGETLVDEGKRTAVETGLEVDWEIGPDEEHVMQVAAGWSVSPADAARMPRTAPRGTLADTGSHGDDDSDE
jgi:hypothetical protein